MTPHKHHDLIVAWAKGAQIQCYFNNKWVDVVFNRPMWTSDDVYRIKPEPKPDVIKYKYITPGGSTFSRESVDDEKSGGCVGLPNLRLTLDGETGKLKKAEVIDEE